MNFCRHAWIWGLLGGGLLAGCAGRPDARWQAAPVIAADPELARLREAARPGQSAAAAYRLGQAYYRRRDWKRAQESFYQALQIDPRHLDAWLALAELFLQLQDPSRAVVLIRRAEALAPRKAQVQRRCGFLYQAAGQPERAEKAWRQALTGETRDPALRLEMGRLLASQERWGEARQIAAQAAAADPDNAAAHQLLGQTYLEQQQPRQALAEFQAAVRLEPDSPTAYLNRAEAESADGDLEAARRSLLQAQRLAPDSALVLVKLGLLHDKQKQPGQALAAYAQALEKDPRFAPAANNLAYCYLQRGEKPEEALRLARLAYQQFPEQAEVVDTLGWACHTQGQEEEALPLLQQAARLGRQEPLIHYHLAAAYQALGRNQEALAHARQALALPRPFAEAAACRALLQKLTR